MRICHVSFGKIHTDHFERWIESISYHTKVLEAMSLRHNVISFHYSNVAYETTHQNVLYRFLMSDVMEQLSLRQLTRAIKSEKPDALIIHGIHSTINVMRIVRRFRDRPIYVQHHGERIFRWPKSLLHRLNDSSINSYFFSSAAMGNDWVNAGLIRDTGKITEVMEATSSFEPELPAGVVENPLTFLWVGRANANKDPKTLVDGFIRFSKQYPTAKLFVVTKTSELSYEQFGIAEADRDRICFVGSLEHGEMKAWYNKVNFVISTSLYEGSGIAVLEAMSAGCIPVLTEIPSFRTMTGHGEVGILFQPSSPQHLADALSTAALMNIGKEKNKVFEHFAANLSASAIAQEIEKTLLKNTGPA
jgi:glycosyltransferase involved in cell wall biosynthesis